MINRVKQEPHELRGTGRSTEQIRTAPHGAVYVCLRGKKGHEYMLAHQLGRGDLMFHTPTFLDNRLWRGIDREIVIDHAVEMTRAEVEMINAHNSKRRLGEVRNVGPDDRPVLKGQASQTRKAERPSYLPPVQSEERAADQAGAAEQALAGVVQDTAVHVPPNDGVSKYERAWREYHDKLSPMANELARKNPRYLGMHFADILLAELARSGYDPTTQPLPDPAAEIARQKDRAKFWREQASKANIAQATAEVRAERAESELAKAQAIIAEYEKGKTL